MRLPEGDEYANYIGEIRNLKMVDYDEKTGSYTVDFSYEGTFMITQIVE